MESIWLESDPRFVWPLTASKIFDIDIVFEFISKYFFSKEKSEGGKLAQVRSQFRSNTQIHSFNHKPRKCVLGTHFTIDSMSASKPTKCRGKGVC